MDSPTTRFAHAGDLLIAYQSFGEGPATLVFLLGWSANVEVLWELPAFARFLRRLSTFARVIIFDRRGTGLSDRGFEDYSMDSMMEDLAAVLDDAGIDQASIFACEGAARLAFMFAAVHPERVASVISFAGHPAAFADDDYPWGASREAFEEQIGSMQESWGDPETINRLLERIAPTEGKDPATRAWWSRFTRSNSRREMMAHFRAMVEVDVRPLLPSVKVPVLIMHRTNDEMARIEASLYMAERIPNARFLELPGDGHFPFFGDAERVAEETEEFITGARSSADVDRILATVLFSDIVGSTEKAAALGDRRWRDTLDAHDALAKTRVAEFKGRIVDHTGDGFLAQFDGPARAIRCALSLRDGVRALGLETRAGIHTGEVEVRGDNIGGIVVHIGARVAAKAGTGEVWVSRTVADLVVGSSVEFEDRGVHVLKGVPGEWQLYAVKA